MRVLNEATRVDTTAAMPSPVFHSGDSPCSQYLAALGEARSGRNRDDYRVKYKWNYAQRKARKHFKKHGDRVPRGCPCEECGDAEWVERHHDDYNRPRVVRYLCLDCHQNWHAENESRAHARWFPAMVAWEHMKAGVL